MERKALSLNQGEQFLRFWINLRPHDYSGVNFGNQMCLRRLSHIKWVTCNGSHFDRQIPRSTIACNECW